MEELTLSKRTEMSRLEDELNEAIAMNAECKQEWLTEVTTVKQELAQSLAKYVNFLRQY